MSHKKQGKKARLKKKSKHKQKQAGVKVFVGHKKIIPDYEEAIS